MKLVYQTKHWENLKEMDDWLNSYANEKQSSKSACEFAKVEGWGVVNDRVVVTVSFWQDDGVNQLNEFCHCECRHSRDLRCTPCREIHKPIDGMET